MLDVFAGLLGLLGDLLAPTPAWRTFWAIFATMALIVGVGAISYAIGLVAWR